MLTQKLLTKNSKRNLTLFATLSAFQKISERDSSKYEQWKITNARSLEKCDLFENIIFFGDVNAKFSVDKTL